MNDIPLGILLGVLAVLLILSAFFSGSETALMTLNRYRLKHLVKQNHRGAIKANRLLKKPDRILGLILLANNAVNIFAASLTTLIAIRIGGFDVVAPAMILLTLALVIFSEAAPKTLGRVKPESLAFISAWVYAPVLKLFYPLVWLINGCAWLLLRLIGINPNKTRNETLNIDELKSIVADAEHLMPSRYQNMLLSILELDESSVEDIMTHRKDIVGIDLEDSIENIIRQLQSSPHTRLPVYKKNIDRVIGFLHIRTILARITQVDFDKQVITDSLNKPFFIPATTSIHKQLQIFKTEKLRIGLVVDEYGDVQGLITLDDLLQAIIGELTTEQVDIKAQKDGTYLVDASISVRELNKITHWNLPTEGPKTLNGLIIEYMETIPESGTSIKLHGHVLEIIECTENTVKQVRFYPKT